MMYSNKFVAVVKCNGKILREDKDTVLIPFGEEYSIYLKNLESKRAVVSISIDGQDVLGGHQLIVDGNSEKEIERFIETLDSGNKFKFIQKTKKIQEHRGDKIDDGIIRIEWQFEKQKNNSDLTWVTNTYHTYWHNNTTGNPCGCNHRISAPSTHYSNVQLDNISSVNVNDVNVQTSSTNVNYRNNSPLRSRNISSPSVDEGITVKGSESSQRFVIARVGQLEPEKHVMVLQLKGINDNGNVVVEPITVKTKQKCNVCGTTNKSINKYCRECGSFLE